MNGQSQSVCYTAMLVVLFLSSASHACRNQEVKSIRQCSNTPLATIANNFGASLTKAIGSQDNVFISPLSIYIALAMTYLGAKGNTADEMEKVLQLQNSGLNKIQLHESLRNLLNVIKQGNDEYSLFLANGIFAQQNYSIDSMYVNNVKNFYQAVIEQVDFVNGQTAAKDKINKFIADATKNKIKDFLNKPLSPMTILALLNAIYFKGTWKIQFSEAKTKSGVFYKVDNSTKTVQFMKLFYEDFRFYEDHNSKYKFIELPYKGGHMSMLLALPMDSKQSAEIDMNSELLCSLNSSMRTKKVSLVVVPKFHLKYRKELRNVLQKLGIQDLFSFSADLTGIRKDGGVRVSSVMHGAVIEVNEEGSEAAATTFITVTRTVSKTNRFIANHPFAFYIVDNRNGLILFSGRVFDP